MELVQAVVLGLLQGIFEWLPVSSEAVITLVMTRLLGSGIESSLNTSIWLHTGTMIAALIYLRKDFIELFRRALIKTKNRKISIETALDRKIVFIALATLLTGLLGGPLYIIGVETLATNPDLFAGLTGIALFLTGLTRMYNPVREKPISDLGLTDTLIVGILQGFSIIPGISRSGSTSFGLLFRNFGAEDTFRLSFLLSVPAVLAANIGLNLFSGFQITQELLVAAAVSALTGYLTIDLMLKVADRAEVAYICFGLSTLSFLPILI